jgi:hypothetical protein
VDGGRQVGKLEPSRLLGAGASGIPLVTTSGGSVSEMMTFLTSADCLLLLEDGGWKSGSTKLNEDGTFYRKPFRTFEH